MSLGLPSISLVLNKPMSPIGFYFLGFFDNLQTFFCIPILRTSTGSSFLKKVNT